MKKFTLFITFFYLCMIGEAAEPDFNLVGSKQEEQVVVLDFSIIGASKEEAKPIKHENTYTYEGVKYVVFYDDEGYRKVSPISFPANTKGWIWNQKEQVWSREKVEVVPVAQTYTPITHFVPQSQPTEIRSGFTNTNCTSVG